MAEKREVFAEPFAVAVVVQDTLADADLDLIAAQQFDTATAVEADVEIGTGVNLGGQGTVVVWNCFYVAEQPWADRVAAPVESGDVWKRGPSRYY